MTHVRVNIIQANPGHAATIADLWNPFIVGTAVTFNSVAYTPTGIARLISDKGQMGFPFLVACNPEITGFATYRQFRAGIGYRRTMEHTIVIAPESQRNGIGCMLMKELEDIARQHGVHSMIGGVSHANLAALRFHLAMGYVEIARLPRVGYKFGRFLDLVLVQKILDDSG